MRPFVEGGLTYPEMIRNQYSESVVNIDAYGGRLLQSITNNPDVLLSQFHDVIVLNFGIVDLSSRPIRRNLYNWLYYKQPRTVIGKISKDSIRKFTGWFHKPLLFFRFKRAWVNKKIFVTSLVTLVETIQNKSNSKVIVLGVNQPGKRIESILPGTTKKVEYANKEIKEKMKLMNIDFIDTFDLIEEENMPDGIHFNQAGHKIIFEKIHQILDKN